MTPPPAHARRRLAGAWGVWGVLLAGIVAASCGHGFPPPELPPFEPIPEPAPTEVEAVLFLVGDAGATEATRSPLLLRLERDIERWSAALGRDSAVAVAFLGDNVYPSGLRDRSHRGFASDSARLWNQIRLLDGPSATAHATAGWFLAGNHDWGGMTGERGVARLANQEREIARARATGLNVVMVPRVGSPGPAVRDFAGRFRLVFIDTHWFIQRPSAADRAAFFDDLEHALDGSDGREIIVLSHHPWRTSGPHGVSEGGRALGYYWLLEKSGTLVQDLNSPLYGDFIDSFRERVKASGRRPLVFAGGHDHSLQVFAGREATDPIRSLVSGAGSKLSPVSEADGLRYAASRPGYMTLVFRSSGELELFVTAGSARHLLCPGDEAARAACMRQGVAAFSTVYSAVIPGTGG